MVAESGSVSNFDSISLSGSTNVIVNQDGEESLTIENDDNVIHYLTNEVHNETSHLGVEDLTDISPARLVFTVSVNHLTGLSISGSGKIGADEIGMVRLDIRVSGFRELEPDGEATRQEVDISGSGKYMSADLRSTMAVAKVSGSGEVTVWAIDSLNVSITGRGSVDYYDGPSVSNSS